jgi:hypothetical protein
MVMGPPRIASPNKFRQGPRCAIQTASTFRADDSGHASKPCAREGFFLLGRRGTLHCSTTLQSRQEARDS